MNHLYEPQGDREITNILSPHDVGYVTALAQDVATTEKNIAAIESGFFSAPNSDWMESEQSIYHIFALTANCLAFMKYGGLNVLITNPRDMPGFVKYRPPAGAPRVLRAARELP